MKEFAKKWWGVLPILLWIGLQMVSFNWVNDGLALRNGPSIAFQYSYAGALGFSVYWIIKKTEHWRATKTKGFVPVIANVAMGLGVIFAVVTAVNVFLTYSNLKNPEYAVNKHGIDMIATVQGGTEVNVYYYEDKGGNFRGSELLGQEYYGEGDFDPFISEEEVEPISGIFYDLEGNVIEQWGDLGEK